MEKTTKALLCGFKGGVCVGVGGEEGLQVDMLFQQEFPYRTGQRAQFIHSLTHLHSLPTFPPAMWYQG